MAPTPKQPFNSWPELLDAISAGYRIYYQAPMDYRPSLVSAVIRKDGKLRVSAIYSDVTFTADEGHLSRFGK